MKESKKLVLVALALLAAITMVLLPLSGCKTEVDTSSPQQEQTGDSTNTEDNTSGGGDSGMGGGGSAGNGDSEEKPGAGESNTELQPCSHQPEADDGDCTTEVQCTVCGEVAVAAKSHDFTGEWQKDAESHWHDCRNEGCNKTDTKAAHFGGTATCVKGRLCGTCGLEYSVVDAAAHRWGKPGYTLSGNGDTLQCTATVLCQHDNSHTETETVPATEKLGQPDVYTLQFENPELFPLTELDLNMKVLGGVTAGSWGGTNDGGELGAE